MESPITFGQKLKELRDKKKISLRDLASQVGLSAGYISQLENNKVNVSGLPAPDNISKLAAALNADETELALLAGKLSNEISNSIKEALLKGDINKEQVFEFLYRKGK